MFATDSAFSNSPPEEMTAPSSFNTKWPSWFSIEVLSIDTRISTLTAV